MSNRREFLAALAASAAAGATWRLTAAEAAPGHEVMPLVDFNGPSLPVNKAGATYPNQYGPEGTAEVGLDAADAVVGRSVRFEVRRGLLYAQFNAHNADGTRGFAREYVARPDAWRFNTFNRLSFWIQSPPEAAPLHRNGQENIQVGTYVKRVKDADRRSDETGGGHWYHHLNVAPTGTWTRAVLNMHPHHLRGASGGQEHGDQAHPTREADYNYFDALTRFYVEQIRRPVQYPAVYRLDEFAFYCEPRPESDQQVYSLAATYVPRESRLILTWSRNKNDNAVRHEVRYGFADLHAGGWAKATPAPGGLVAPPGFQGYNGMVYTTTDLALAGRAAVFLGIRPENSQTFSQIALPLATRPK
jgi:hypothetical protein